MSERRSDGTYYSPLVGGHGEQRLAGVKADDGRIVAGLKVENYRQSWAQPAPPPSYSGGSGYTSSGGGGGALILLLIAVGLIFGPMAAVGVGASLVGLCLAFYILGKVLELSFSLIGAILSGIFSLPGLLCIGLIIGCRYYIGTEHPAWLEKKHVAKPVDHKSFVKRLFEQSQPLPQEPIPQK